MRIATLLLAAAACGSPTPEPHTQTAPPTLVKQEPPVQQQTDEARARDFVAKLVAHDWDSAIAAFDDTMRGALPKDKLTSLWVSIETSAGPFKSIESVAIQTANDARIAAVKATFERAPLVLRVILDGHGRVSGFFIAPGDTAAATWQTPTYAHIDAFEEKPIAVRSSHGTWTTPKTGKPYPAVVLVHGSGPGDADETIGALKVFKDLAWGLASRGIAVLRYDKDLTNVRTQKEEVEDAAHMAVALVTTQPDVDPKRVVLVGHSQGGYLAPRIAKADSSIKGIVMLAGSTRPLQDSLLAQVRYMATLQPTEPKLKEAIVLAERFKKDVESLTLKPDDKVDFPFASAVPGAYFLDVRSYQPDKVAAGLSIPMLVLQGERDYQVTVAEDFAGWKATLGKKKKVTLKTYPGLNHAFTAGTGPSTPAEYSTPGHVDEQVVIDIADFATKLK